MLISWKKNFKINGLEATECYLFLAREKSRVQAAFSFGLPSHWSKKWCEIFKPITNCNIAINHLIGKEVSGKRFNLS